MNFFFAIWFMFFCTIFLQIVSQIIKNVKAPVVTVSATVADKRETARKHKYGQDYSYYVRFQTSDGVELELQLYRDAYEILTVGDSGMLTHQGTWYKGFKQ